MFCSKCGHQLADNTRFCSECGAKLESITALCSTIDNHDSDDTAANAEQTREKIVYVAEKGDDEKKSTYADTSFNCAMFALLCWCCCGLQLAGGGLAALFGILAIRNREANVVKAYIGLGLGVVEFLFFIIIMIAGLKENV